MHFLRASSLAFRASSPTFPVYPQMLATSRSQLPPLPEKGNGYAACRLRDIHVRFAGQVPDERRFQWRSIGGGSDMVRIGPADPQYVAGGCYYVAVWATSGRCNFKIRVRARGRARAGGGVRPRVREGGPGPAREARLCRALAACGPVRLRLRQEGGGLRMPRGEAEGWGGGEIGRAHV